MFVDNYAKEKEEIFNLMQILKIDKNGVKMN